MFIKAGCISWRAGPGKTDRFLVAAAVDSSGGAADPAEHDDAKVLRELPRLQVERPA
jgi:hypothetical protein